MKKLLVVLVSALIICFINFYKTPVINVDVALNNAEKYLLNPPEEWGVSISFNGLDELSNENISVYLREKNGFWNELTNRMQFSALGNFINGFPII